MRGLDRSICPAQHDWHRRYVVFERPTYALEGVMDPAKTLSIKGLPTLGLRCSLWHRLKCYQVDSLVRALGIHRRLSG